MKSQSAEIAAPRLLARLLQPGSAWPLDQCLQIVRRLAAEVQSLHRSGRTHRALDAEAVIVDEGRPPRLSPCPAQRYFGGDDPDPQFCPAELAEGDGLELPESIEAAAAVLKAHGVSLDPRQVDIYQLGTLLYRLVSGQTVASYLYTARGKALVPAPARPLLERMLGHDGDHRFSDMAQVLMAIDELHSQADAVQEAPAMRDTPPRGSQIGPIDNTPRHGHAPASLDEVAPAQSEDLPFQKLGHYRILGRIGRGGMGDVYQGYDDSLQREVAIKVLPAELARNADFVRRFHAEATAAAQIAHPNVVPIFFIGEDAGHHFFAMQYVRGQSLASRLAQRRRLPLEEVQRVLEQCLAGLGAAHAQGLIHRDIKPGNILLESESGRAMLVDFGLVRRADEASRMTATGIVMGTVDYIAPEQARGQPVDSRADLYSLGVLAYQLLSGRLPFVADTPTAMIFQHAYEKPLPLDEAAPDVPEPMVRIVARLMAKNTDERYPNTGQVLADLEAAREGRDLSPVREAPVEPEAAADPAPIDMDVDWEERLTSMLPPTPRYGRWQRARDFAATMFRRHAPEFIRSLQSTTQQVDGAVAHYQRRRDHLARLVEEGQRVLESLPAGPEREGHRQSVEDLRSQLAKADATLAQLNSQRDLLQARLRAVGASNDLGLEKVATRSRRRRQFVLAGSLLALFAAGWIAWALLPGMLRSSSFVMLPQGPVVSAVDQPKTGDLPAISEIDLLKSVNVDRDRESGKWEFGSNGLTAHAHPWDGLKRLVIPVDVAGDYDLQFEFTRNQGSGSLGMHYPVNGVPAHVALSRFNGKYGAIVSLIPPDQPITTDIASAIKKPNPLVNGRRYRATISVRTSGNQSQVRVSLDDGSQWTYSGPTERLRTAVPGVRSPIASRPTLDAEGANVTFHRVVLLPVSASTALPFPTSGGESPMATAGNQRHDYDASRLQKSLACFNAHKGDVRFALWTPDGHMLITGGHDRVVKLWDMASGKCARELPGPDGMCCGAVSHDGRILAAGAWDKTVRLWDIERRVPLAVMQGHTQEVNALAFSPDDKVLVSGGWDAAVRCWDVASRTLVRALPTQTVSVNALAISSDGKTLATATGNWKLRNMPGEVKLWDMASGKELTTIAKTGARFNAAAFSPDGTTLAYGGTDYVVNLWDVAKRHERGSLRLLNEPVFLQFLAQGRLLAAGERLGGVTLWDVTMPGEPRIRFQGHKGTVHSIGVSPDGSLLATAGADGTVGLWPLPREAWAQSTSAGANPTSADFVRRWPAGNPSADKVP